MEHSTIDRIISRAELRKLIGISRTQEWRLLQSGEYPAPVVVRDRIIGFRESTYTAWLTDNERKSSLAI